MTSHLAPVPIPNGSESHDGQDEVTEPPLMVFYNEAIKLYDILDIILADVYNAWCSRLRRDQLPAPTMSLGSLDIVLKVERELTMFKANLPSFLRWTSGPPAATPPSPDLNIAIAQQKNVLHARCVSYG
jgi:hypothetical protein